MSEWNSVGLTRINLRKKPTDQPQWWNTEQWAKLLVDDENPQETEEEELMEQSVLFDMKKKLD